MQHAVVTVVGKDMVGILAKVATICAQCNANVVDVTQSVMKDIFNMVMFVEIERLNCSFSDFSKKMKVLGDEIGLQIYVMHEDIFNSMHRI